MIPDTVWTILDFLGRCSHFLRPARLLFDGAPPKVSVSGDVITIRIEAIFDRGLLLWMPRGGRCEVPIPQGLNLGTEMSCRNCSQTAEFCTIVHTGMVFNLRQMLSQSQSKWQDAEVVLVEVCLPCDTMVFLDLPYGKDGKRETNGQVMTTSFLVRKKHIYRDVAIRNYQWRRTLHGYLPMQRLAVYKNGDVQDLQAHIVRSASARCDIGDVVLDLGGKLQTGAVPVHPRTTDDLELVIPLSFTEPEDSCEIVIQTKQ